MDNRKERIQPDRKKRNRTCYGVYGSRCGSDVVCISGIASCDSGEVPFDYTVILGGLFGGAVAVLNFF